MHMNKLAAFLGVFVMATMVAACGATDPGITTAVKARFALDDTVKAYQIDVTTENKVVSLTGAVETAAAKTQAVSLARSTEGVTDVVDNLTVTMKNEPSMMDRMNNAVSDAGITTEVKTKLLADTTVAGLKIDVDTQGGVVMLTGAVKNQAEKDQAMLLARGVGGVKDVMDHLTIGQ